MLSVFEDRHKSVVFPSDLLELTSFDEFRCIKLGSPHEPVVDADDREAFFGLALVF